MTLNSRIVVAPKIPFITYEFQDQLILDLIAASGIIEGIEAHDVLIEKSRDMGATWACILACLWLWHFKKDLSFLWVSRKEELVDSARGQDPKTLFAKADFVLKHEPSWMRPMITRTHRHLYNEYNGTTIDGESTTADVGKGDRRTIVFLDEFAAVLEGDAVLAATADVTNCRLFNSTPKGPGNAFYTMRNRVKDKKTLHWPIHPVKGNGLWHDEQNKPRSDWYDRECERRGSKKEIAEQLDIDYFASGDPFFDLEVLQETLERHVRPPMLRGDLYDYIRRQPLEEFVDMPDGSLQLWTHLDHELMPPEHQYVIGVDVSGGSDASNSVAVIGDRRTMEKVGELATINVLPHEFADYVLALGRWFYDALIIWETNGTPGTIFTKIVTGAKYNHLYYRKREEGVGQKPTKQVGWFSSPDAKGALIGELRRAYAKSSFLERSENAIEEAKQYVHLPNGSAGFISTGERDKDPSGAKHNHGDRIIATALCLKGLSEMKQEIQATRTVIPMSCWYRRRQEYEQSRQKALAW